MLTHCDPWPTGPLSAKIQCILTEVNKLDVGRRREQDVVAFDVAMHHTV